MDGAIPFFAFKFLIFYECIWKYLLFLLSEVKLYIVANYVIDS